MNLKWILIGLALLAILILLNTVGPLKGSSNSDFPDRMQPDRNPLPECPDSPNCVRLSLKYDSDPQELFDILPEVLEQMHAENFQQNSQSLQTDAVFRIRLFGFRDDFSIRVTESDEIGSSVVHITSRSRVGRGDLGVNRRRAKTFFNLLNNYFNPI